MADIDNRTATAISFPGETLKLLKRIADSEERSLAALIRIIVEGWLRTPDGSAAIRKSTKEKFDIRKIEQSALDKT